VNLCLETVRKVDIGYITSRDPRVITQLEEGAQVRKTLVWVGAVAAAAATHATPAAADQPPTDHDRPCDISGQPNKRDCLLQFELRVAQQDSIPGKTSSLGIQTLDASQNGAAIGTVTGMMAFLNSGPSEGIYTFRLSGGQGQVGVQFAQPGNSQQTTSLIVTGGSGVFDCATGSGYAEGGDNNSPIVVKLHLSFSCKSR
jgi:opacity protein-like surface antigen